MGVNPEPGRAAFLPLKLPAGCIWRRHWPRSVCRSRGSSKHWLETIPIILLRPLQRLIVLYVYNMAKCSYAIIIFLFGVFVSVGALSGSINRSHRQVSISTAKLTLGGQALVKLFRQCFPLTVQRKVTIWEMAQITALCGALSGIWYLQRHLRRKDSDASSSKSDSKLNKTIAVNEDDSTGKCTHST